MFPGCVFFLFSSCQLSYFFPRWLDTYLFLNFWITSSRPRQGAIFTHWWVSVLLGHNRLKGREAPGKLYCGEDHIAPRSGDNDYGLSVGDYACHIRSIQGLSMEQRPLRILARMATSVAYSEEHDFFSLLVLSLPLFVYVV